VQKSELLDVRNQVKWETIKLMQQEQHRISMKCKWNPKKNSGNT